MRVQEAPDLFASFARHNTSLQQLPLLPVCIYRVQASVLPCCLHDIVVVIRSHTSFVLTQVRKGGGFKMPSPTGDGTPMLHVHSLEMVRLLDERLQSSLTAHFAQQEDLIRGPAAVQLTAGFV